MTKDEIEIAARRLGESKLRLLHKEPFFASLLMGTPIVLDEPEKTGATDGKKIYVNPRLAIASTPQFLDFLLTHEVMHIALNHCIRYPNMNLAWNVAADCVANSIILESYPKDYSEFDVEKWHCIPPTCPDGSKGCVHTVQEIYDMLPNRLKREGDFSKLSFDSHGRFARGTDEQSNPDDGETISIDSMALADAMESLGGEDCGEDCGGGSPSTSTI